MRPGVHKLADPGGPGGGGGYRRRQVVPPGTHLQRNSALLDQFDSRPVVNDVRAMADPVWIDGLDRIHHRGGWGVFTGVNRHLEPGVLGPQHWPDEVLDR